MIEETSYGPRFAEPQVGEEPEGMDNPQEEQQEFQEQAPVQPHPSQGEYGPIINYLFGEKIEPNKDPRLEPIINLIQEQMRGKSGFLKLGNNIFYKNGSMIEAVTNPNSVPEGVAIKDLTKLVKQ